VAEVAQRDREPALLLAVGAHAHRHAPLGRRPVWHRKRGSLVWLWCGRGGAEASEEYAEGLGLGREGPGVGAGDGKAKDGEGGVAEGGGQVGHGASSGFLSFL
jgi:hypothetical protein